MVAGRPCCHHVRTALRSSLPWCVQRQHTAGACLACHDFIMTFDQNFLIVLPLPDTCATGPQQGAIGSLCSLILPRQPWPLIKFVRNIAIKL